MSKLKKIAALGLFVSSMFFVGCEDTILSSDDSITLGTLTPSHVDISLTSTGTVAVEVEASEDITAANNFSFDIENSAGEATNKINCNVSYTTGDKGTATIAVTADSDCPKDTFTVTITATAGTATSSKYFTVFVTNGIETPTDVVSTYSNVKIMVAAASGDNANNCASVDGSTFTYTAGKTSAALQAKCDFVYYYISEATISAPSAVNSAINSGYADWTQLNNTKFKAATSSDWDAATTTSDASIVSASAGATATQATGLAIGDVYAFVTESGKKGLLKVVALAAGYESDKYITIDIKVQD